MPSYAITIDDGLCLASAPSSTYPDMATAIRLTAQTALLFAADDRTDTIRTDPIACEVRDRQSREVRRFTVAVTIIFRDA